MRRTSTGSATLADLAAVRHQRAVELIDGVIVDKAAPSPDHGSAQASAIAQLHPRFNRRGEGGPLGGWWLMTEVEIREWLDPAIGTELPIRVWLGVVRRHAQRRGWIVQGDLVARRPFPWSKLRDLVREHVRPGLSNQAIVARIREDALLSRRVAEGVRLRAAIADERAKRSRKG